MFVTDALREKVNQSITQLDRRAVWLEALAARTDDWATDSTTVWAAERALHVAMECCTDAANMVIDALVMREPGGYADIIRVLMEEGVVPVEWYERFEEALSFRNRLVHDYNQLDDVSVMHAVHRYAPLFRPYAVALRQYLQIR